MSRYCLNCKQKVKPKRIVGFWFVMICFITGGLWAFSYPLRRKRCPKCKDTNWGVQPKFDGNMCK